MTGTESAILVGETRTARKKRLKAERAAGVNIQLAAAERQRVGRLIQNLSARLCSIWWAEHVARNQGPYLPDTPCDCSHCRRRRKWPNVNFGSTGISYECFTLEFMRPASDKRAMTDDEARYLGLHKVRRQSSRGEIKVLVAGCERCEGLRPRGERYCMACRALVKREMREAGYL